MKGQIIPDTNSLALPNLVLIDIVFLDDQSFDLKYWA